MAIDEQSSDSTAMDVPEERVASSPSFLIVSDVFGFLPDAADLPGGAGREHRLLRLADLSGRPDLDGERLHAHLFAEGGFGQAVDGLREIDGRDMIGLGFSAGGSVLWRAAAEGLRLSALICVSSTRLRHETTPLAIPTRVIWGGGDPNRPSEAWNRAVPRDTTTYPGESHAFYRHRVSVAAQALWADLRGTIEGI